MYIKTDRTVSHSIFPIYSIFRYFTEIITTVIENLKKVQYQDQTVAKNDFGYELTGMIWLSGSMIKIVLVIGNRYWYVHTFTGNIYIGCGNIFAYHIRVTICDVLSTRCAIRVCNEIRPWCYVDSDWN